ncbi:MAG: hypothetical protein ACAH21_09035 [Ramlibacter sp.]|nr:hypothetical protein [Ramlibacter sp.]
MDLRKLFQAPEADTDIEYGSPKAGDSVPGEYRAEVRRQLKKLGVPAEMVAIDIRSAGSADDKPVFMVMLRLVTWQQRPGVRLLLGLPILELNARKAFQASWLSEVSHFGGLWLHPSSQLKQSNAVAQVQELLLYLETNRQAEDDSAKPSGTDEHSWPSTPAGVTDLSPLGDDRKR